MLNIGVVVFFFGKKQRKQNMQEIFTLEINKFKVLIIFFLFFCTKINTNPLCCVFENSYVKILKHYNFQKIKIKNF